MSRFRGRFDYTVDAKGRVNIPSKFRKALSPEAAETFVICQAPGNCLRAYPQDLWDRYEDELASRPQTPETLKHRRLLYAALSDSTLDAQGRITLTSSQMANASISKNVALIGQNEYIEIWDADRLAGYIGSGDDFDAMFFKSVEAGLRTIDKG
jgi:MraZ protein